MAGQPSRVLPAVVVILTAAKNLAVVFAEFSREDADDEKTGQSNEPP